MSGRVILGRIGTVIWNARFSLGMWVGGFTSARRDYDRRDHDPAARPVGEPKDGG